MEPKIDHFDIWVTTNGKKCEVIVKKILRGDSILIEDTSLQNNNSLNEYFSFVKTLEFTT